jgi:hypothetical protein
MSVVITHAYFFALSYELDDTTVCISENKKSIPQIFELRN